MSHFDPGAPSDGGALFLCAILYIHSMNKWLVFMMLLLAACSPAEEDAVSSLSGLSENLEQIEGRAEYLSSPYVTAGDQLYVVGYQDGSFPDLGWHVPGEMGGIWHHPIKLMDGFRAGVMLGDSALCLPPARSFVQYPMASRIVYPEIRGVEVEQFQFVPDGQPAVVVEYAITNVQDKTLNVTFTVSARTDLRPVWLGERTGMFDGPDSLWYDHEQQAVVARDLDNPWFVYMGSSLPPSDYWLYAWCNAPRSGQGDEGTLLFDLKIRPGETAYVPVTIAGSHISANEARQHYRRVRENALQLFREKRDRYAKIAATSRLEVPDKELEQAFRWLKYNTDWLVMEVEGVGRGLTAGIPDYPWWFGADSEYALQGALMAGQRDIVYETIDLLAGISDSVNSSGRIVHEVSSNGAVFNPGNINETPQFASLIWKVYNWTGDPKFLEKYYPVVADGLDWLLDERDLDGNYLPDGFGMMEIHGLDSEMIDVAAYTQKAFSDAVFMAEVLGRPQEADAYREKADALARIINEEFWVEEQDSYADFIGTVDQARRLIREAIHRADSLDKPWAVRELEQTFQSLEGADADEKRAFVVHHNWVVNTPMETGVADREKALRALETGSRFTNPFGVYVTGIDRDEAAADQEGSFVTNKKIFSYIGAVMTLPTGVQAVAENNYGRPDAALDYLQRMTRTFSYAMPGSMYEVSPDYGMIVQAWNIFSFAVPVVEQFFGIRPDASENLIRITPQMPTAWPEAALYDVPVLDGSLSLAYQRENERLTLTVDWDGSAELRVGFPKGQYSTWQVNGETIEAEKLEEKEVVLLESGQHRLIIE